MNSAEITLTNDQLTTLADLIAQRLHHYPEPTPAAAVSASEQKNKAARITLNVSEACSYLGCSWATWRTHIEPHVRVVRLGRKKLVAVTELERWAAEHGEAVGDFI